MENKTNVTVKVEPGLLNQFCGDPTLQNAAFIFLHITLPENTLFYIQYLQLQSFSHLFAYLLPLYLNSEAESTSLFR